MSQFWQNSISDRQVDRWRDRKRDGENEGQMDRLEFIGPYYQHATY